METPYRKTSAKALGTYIRIYYLFRIECLSTNIKLILYKALIRSIMVYACPTWEYAMDAHLKNCRTELSTLLATLTGAHWPTI
jgi:hypothetical protein